MKKENSPPKEEPGRDFLQPVNSSISKTDAQQATLDEHPAINFDDVISCTKCDGSGETQPNVECKRCRGTGIQNIDDLLPTKEEELLKKLEEKSKQLDKEIKSHQVTNTEQLKVNSSMSEKEGSDYNKVQHGFSHLGKMGSSKEYITLSSNTQPTDRFQIKKLEVSEPVVSQDQEETLPFEFVEWYSGMDKDKIRRAYEKWLREYRTPQPHMY